MIKIPFAIFVVLLLIIANACKDNPIKDFVISDEFEFETFSKTWYAPFCAEDSTSCAKIEAVFPIIADNPKGSGAIINDSINYYIKKMIGEFEMDKASIHSTPLPNLVARFFNEYKDFTEEFADFNLPWVVEIRGKLLCNTAETVAVELGNYSFTGGAHPSYWVRLTNFDAKTGKVLYIEDFINDFEKLKILAKKQFRMAREMAEDELFEDKGFMFEESFSLPANMAMTTEGLYFFYNPYEVGPYVLGTTEFTIPFKVLEDILIRK